MDGPARSNARGPTQNQRSQNAEAGGYIAYSSPYDVDDEDQTLTHTVDVSLFPNRIGQTQPRIFTLAGDTLRLSTATPFHSNGKLVNSYLAWRRVS